MKIKITKRKLVREINNDMCHNYYWLYNGQIWDDDHVNFRRFRFIIWFDIFDVMEFFDKEWVDKSDLQQYADELAYGVTELVKSFDDCDEFYAYCDATIDRYNGK